MAPPFDITTHVARHGAALRSLALELTGDAAAADDAVQETWLGAMKSPPRHDAAISGWLATLLKNAVRGLRRQDRRRVRREDAVASMRGGAVEDHAQGVARSDVAHALLAAVDTLEPPYRDVVWQRYFEGRAPRDIAAASGEPLATVKSRLQRALATLRERLEQRGGADWRGAFVAAFGLRAASVVGGMGIGIGGAVLMATWTKVTAVCAAAAIAAVVWWPRGDAPTPTEHARNDGVAANVVTAPPIDAPGAPQREPAEAAPKPKATAPPPAAATPVPTTIVRGRAVDAATKEPLAGVKVTLSSGNVDAKAPPASMLTAGDGVFELVVRAESEPNIDLVRDDRAQMSWRGPKVFAGHPEDVGDVPLRRGRLLRGRVTSSDGAIVPEKTLVTVAVTPARSGDRCVERPQVAAHTNADGSFTIDTPAPFGPTTWKLSSDAHLLEPPVQIDVGETGPAEVVLVVRPREAIRGIVVDEAGQPVAGVGISDHPSPFSTSMSRDDGHFTLPRRRSGGVPLATIYIAHAPGCEPSAPVTDVAWGATNVRIVLRRTRPFAIEVEGEGGDPVEDFGIAMFRAGISPLAPKQVRQRGTHAGGKLAVDDVARGSTTLRVMPSAPEWTPSEPFVVGTDEPHRVVLRRRVPLLLLVQSNDKPVPGVSIELLRERGGASASPGTHTETSADQPWMQGATVERITDARTDAAGCATLLRDADMTGCVLRTRVDNEPPGIVRDFALPPIGEPLRIELPRHGRIAGRVDLRGRPRDSVSAAITAMNLTGGRAIHLDPDGAFTVKDLQTGRYTVHLSMRTGGRVGALLGSERDVEVTAGGTAQVAYDLADFALARVRGTVRSDGPLPDGLAVYFVRQPADPSNHGILASPTIAADGTFACDELLPGTYLLAFRTPATKALVPGYLPEPLVVAAGEEVRPQLRYRPRRLVVNLKQADGTTVRGERILVRCGGAIWPWPTMMAPSVDERVVIEPAPLLPIEFRGWTVDAWSAPVVMPPDREEYEVTVILPAAR